MESRPGERRLHPAWWTLILLVCIVALVFLSAAFFSRSFTSYVPVTLSSDRAGLVMESGAKVKMHGVQIGRVADIKNRNDSVRLRLEIYPDEIKYIPANVQARIRATTAFGAKYVELVDPDDPSPKRLTAGAVIMSQNVSTEVNTVFQNLVGVIHQIDPA